ncbi:hypothetical protein [Stenotrophomonas cyclobalanopsidis]|uniref:hypothetical protein n=1 Tax=Stenotrophomonas cyclobalanopsidis TaxID=2771362 RepID=UPI0028B1528B|nr:hypothetical protein [Stenotrophomonas cyclobalanopsidis]
MPLADIRNAPQALPSKGPELLKPGVVARLREQWGDRPLIASAREVQAPAPAALLHIHRKPALPPASVFSPHPRRTAAAPKMIRPHGPAAHRIAQRMHSAGPSATRTGMAARGIPLPRRSEQHPHGLGGIGPYPVRISELHPKALMQLPAASVETGNAVNAQLLQVYNPVMANADPAAATADRTDLTRPLQSTESAENDVGASFEFDDGGNEWEVWEETFSPEEQQALDERFEREERQMAALDARDAGKPMIAPKPVFVDGHWQTQASPKGNAMSLLEAIRSFDRETGLRRVEKDAGAPVVEDASLTGIFNRGAQELFGRHDLTGTTSDATAETDETFAARDDSEWDA